MVTQEPHATPVTPITTKQATVLHVQYVVVMPLVRAVCSVLIQLDNVPAMLDMKGPSVMLLKQQQLPPPQRQPRLKGPS